MPSAPNPLPTFSPVRAALVFTTLMLGLGALVGRVAYLQTYGREQTIARAERQQQQSEVLQARRGSIFDRNGMLMAGTVQTQTVFIDPKFMLDRYQDPRENRGGLVEMDRALTRLAEVLDLDGFELSKNVGEFFDKRFMVIAEQVGDDAAAMVREMNLPGVGLTPGNQRNYPMGSIAAHVLGTMRKDGVGLEGLELKFDKELAGQNGFKRSTKDARRRSIAVAAEDYLPPLHGRHVVLTIDANLQYMAEQELGDACKTNGAKRGEIVVMDPKTGEILALANYPTFNPQNLEDSTPELRRNAALVMPYEPGSTLKPFIMGPALKWRMTRTNEIWPVPGITWRTNYGRRVTDVHGYGPLSTWDGLVKSSNIVMSMLANRMGNRNLHRALYSFGFGQTTGIELPGEDPGRLIPLPKWTRYSTESIAQGYEIMVTPLQLAKAFSAYANGGRLVQPHLVQGVLDADGELVQRVKPKPLTLLPEVMDPGTSLEMRRIMCDTIVRGTGTRARSRTWNIFGKTGTAHISLGKAGYSPTLYTSSFVSAAPAEDPRLVVVMVVHEADRRIAHFGGTVVAPNAGKFYERALSYLNVPASPELTPPPPQIASVLVNYDPRVYRRPAEPKSVTATASVAD